MQENYKVLFIGDIVGKSGRKAVYRFLSENKGKYDFIIANCENASHGFGLTKKNHDELISYGINCLTSGNHIWDKKDIFQYIDESNVLVRPYNYHSSAQGVGIRVFENIAVLNFLGKTFMPPIECPFVSLEKAINEFKNEIQDKIIFIDFHAEATAEKQCFARYAVDFNVNCVIGTHTHVQTSDEKIIENKLAYLTDAGFCGSKNSIIGMEYEASYRRLLTSINERFEIEESYPLIFNACEINFKNNIPVSINRISLEYNNNEDGKSED